MNSNDEKERENFTFEEEKTDENKFLTFMLGQEEYGIEISCIKEIIGIQKITEIPDMPRYVRGVINLRGKVVPALDVRIHFGMEERAYDEKTCIIVVEHDGTSTGLIVDQVSEVTDIHSDSIEPPPRINRSSHNRFVQGLGKVNETVKILLNIQQLLYEDDLEPVM